MVYELSSSLAALAFATVLFIVFLKRRPREVNGRDANNSAAPNNGTAAGASSTHASSEGQEIDTSAGYDFEVFLSFRGPDTRSGFTDFLYTSLNDAGIHTFKDDEELRVGEEFAPELVQAINQSKISIPIFSKGYASSAWCLKELVRMVECQKTGRQKIMPLFYDVAPSEVRYQTGSFGDALLLHENNKRYGEDTINEWKASLSVVGEISGWDLHLQSPRREGDFAKKLTEEVFKELKKAYLAVSDSLVNVDKHVDAIMEMIGAQTSETRIIGIHGMGGIGKTTIAKLIYNKLSHDFQYCCFLRDIRETSKVKGIHRLQNQLIFEILKEKCMDIKDIDEGRQTIKERLSNKRVLLLLDDVEEENHIDALVGKGDLLGKGSKIIVTTRNKVVLNVREVDNSYELSVMDSDQSLQLFSKHAFRRDSPLDEYMDQSKRATSIAGGLPLALEVIGSLLCRTKKEMWDAQLKKLESAPHDKVLNKLKISYDALKLQQKRIFLDIACFFIGHNKDIMIHFWDEYDFFPEQAMIVLENMSLIKINEDNKVWMHDQLKDLGREMVRQSSDMKIEKQSRAWDPKVGMDLLRRHKGKKEVEALCLKLDHTQQYCFTYEDFESLSSLRFLKVNSWMDNFCAEERLLWHKLPLNVPPTNENSYLLPQLRWLSWHNFPPTFNVANFSVENIVVLDLSSSIIIDDWKGWSHIEEMKNLKSLNMSSCLYLRRLPDKLGSNLASLEYLYLRKCVALEMLPNTIGNLESLIKLDISYTGIQELPDSIGKLKNLKSLNMSGCRNLRRLPDKLGSNLASLEYLYLRKCVALEMLPNTIGNLESLIKLDISYTGIQELPDSIRKLKNLKVVKMKGSGIWKIPHAFSTILESLEEIEVFQRFGPKKFHMRIDNGICRNQSLRILRVTGMFIYALPPRLPDALIKLDLAMLYVHQCPDLSNLTNLEELRLVFGTCNDHGEPYGFVEDPMPRWIGNLSKLESLELLFHCETTPLTDISLPPRLKSLSLRCQDQRRFPMECLSNLKNLSSLYISSHQYLEYDALDFQEINVQDLRIRSPDDLRSEDGGEREGGDFPEDLRLWGIPQVEILPYLVGLQEYNCDHLVELSGELPRSLDSSQQVQLNCCSEINIAEITQNLKLKGFNKLLILPDLSCLNKLSRLEVSCCHNLVEISGELPKSLVELEISFCSSLQRLPVLSSLEKLKSVKIESCAKLNVEAILRFARKDPLDSLLPILPDRSDSNEPRRLRAENCSNLVEVQGEIPKSLEILDIFCCEGLHKLPNLSSLVKLREVRISECHSLVEIQGEFPGTLERLSILLCESLLKLPDLSSSKKLQRVDIKGCAKLKGEAIFGSSRKCQANLWENLRYLQICGLGQLKILPDLS